MVRVGNPVQVQPSRRRVSAQSFGVTFSPEDLPSLVAWYDFSDPTTLYTDAGTTPVSADSDLIYQVANKGGSLPLVQVTAGQRPTYKVNIMNGRSVGRFDGTDDRLMTSTFLMASSASTCFVVVRQGAAPSDWDTCLEYGFNVRGETIGMRGGASTVTFTQNGSAGFNVVSRPSPLVDGTSYVLTHVGDMALPTGEIRGYVNGVPAASIDATVNNAGPLTDECFIVGSGGGGNWWPGDIGEVVICNDDLTTAQLNNAGGYLATKWGVTWTPIP